MAVNDDRSQVRTVVAIDGVQFEQMGIKEVVLGESLTTPGLQTAVTLQSQIYNTSLKNFDQMKNKDITISMATADGSSQMVVRQKVYRLDNREFMPLNIGQTEEFTVHACDQTLLNDAKSLVSKSWKCTKPSEIVDYVLNSCVGATDTDIESAGPGRDYLAENIHPFQVIAQQCNVALANGDDPSFTHYMTFDPFGGGGIHHFRSLKSLCERGTSKITYYQSETGAWPGDSSSQPAINFMFPCDFDLLSDLLNGVDEKGQNINTFSGMNLLSGAMQAFGNQAGMQGGCGIGGGNYKIGQTNSGTAGQQNGCEMKIEEYLLKRQARMSLLEKDKVALRITARWNPDIHAGDIITLHWWDKQTGRDLYGSGDYLVSSMMHKIQHGGFGTTTLDCVSTTAGGGVV